HVRVPGASRGLAVEDDQQATRSGGRLIDETAQPLGQAADVFEADIDVGIAVLRVPAWLAIGAELPLAEATPRGGDGLHLGRIDEAPVVEVVALERFDRFTARLDEGERTAVAVSQRPMKGVPVFVERERRQLV